VNQENLPTLVHECNLDLATARARLLRVAFVPIVIFLVAVAFLPVLFFFVWLFSKKEIGGY
jgi:hypothetical protein